MYIFKLNLLLVNIKNKKLELQKNLFLVYFYGKFKKAVTCLSSLKRCPQIN
jgi:hypothetical protein